MTAITSLVTGGNGFIGRHLVRLLVERGERVRTLDLEGGAPANPEVEVIRGSICDQETVREALSGVHRLYHLAANSHLWTPRKADYLEVNFHGTRTVLETAARFDLERIVYTSTESILVGRHRHPAAAMGQEPAELRLEDMPGPYCRSKYLAEREARKAARRGQPVVIVNPTLPVGPGDHRLTPPTSMILTFLNGAAPAYLDCEFNMIDVRDAALGHILAAETGQVGQRYILGNENWRLNALLGFLEECTGLTMPRLKVPYWLALTTGAVSEFVADHLTRKPPIAPLTGVRLARTPMTFDCAQTTRELGLPQTPIRESLADAVAWLDSQGLIRRQMRHRPADRAAARPHRSGPQHQPANRRERDHIGEQRNAQRPTGSHRLPV